MRIREPVVAGQFYPDEPKACRRAIESMLPPVDRPQFTDSLIGGLVPHAGWSYSGPVATTVFAALAASCQPKVVILFGGMHRHRGREAAVFGSGRWESPLGPVAIDARLVERILGYGNQIIDDPHAHEQEHSIEVQVPLVRHFFPEATVVPIMVPPTRAAVGAGEAVGRTLKAYRYQAVIVGTTDLTHYGPGYGFEPSGSGPPAHRWAKEENDRHFIDLVCDMNTDGLIDEARTKKNACSAGAATATLAACGVLGATRGILLEHTSSAEVYLGRGDLEPENFVGYAGMVLA